MKQKRHLVTHNTADIASGFVNRLLNIYKAVSLYRNWPIYFLDHLGFINTFSWFCKLRNGLKFEVRSKTVDKLIVNEVFGHNNYLSKLSKIDSHDVVFDIGAQIGTFSVYAATLCPKGSVYSFEPTSANFKLLQNNVKLNQLKNIRTFNYAISKVTGSTVIYTDPSNTGGHSLIQNFSTTSNIEQKVKSINLNKFCISNKVSHIDFLKLDCEGAEYDILNSIPKSLFSKIDKFAIETHNIDKKRNKDVLIDVLLKHGYHVQIFFNPKFSTSIIHAQR